MSRPPSDADYRFHLAEKDAMISKLLSQSESAVILCRAFIQEMLVSSCSSLLQLYCSLTIYLPLLPISFCPSYLSSFNFSPVLTSWSSARLYLPFLSDSLSYFPFFLTSLSSSPSFHFLLSSLSVYLSFLFFSALLVCLLLPNYFYPLYLSPSSSSISVYPVCPSPSPSHFPPYTPYLISPHPPSSSTPPFNFMLKPSSFVH